MDASLQSESESELDLLRKKREIQRALTRARLAIIVILTVVIGLAFLALGGVYLARQNLDQAENANRLAQDRLYHSFLSQARAERVSKTLGSKDRALAAITSAAAIQPSVELASEALNILSLTSFDRTSLYWPTMRGVSGVESDAKMKFFARFNNSPEAVVFRWSDNSVLLRVTNSAPAVAARFTEDSRLVAFRCADESISVWDLETGLRRFSVKLDNPGHQGIFGFDMSSTHRLIAAGEFASQQLRLFSTENGAEQSPLPIKEVELLAFSPAETNLIAVVPRGRRIQIWDFAIRRMVVEKEFTSDLSSISWSTNGTRLALGSSGGEVMIWNIPEDTTTAIRAHEGFAIASIDPGGTLVATSGWDGRSKFWEADTGLLLFTTREGLAMKFAQDGEHLFYQREGGGIGSWRVGRSDIFRTFHCSGPGTKTIFGVDLDSSGEHFAIMRSDGLHVFDSTSGERKAHLPIENQWAQNLFFASTEKSIFGTSRKGFHKWSYRPQAQGKRNLEEEFSLPAPEGWETAGITISPDEQVAVAVLSSYALQLFDLKGRTSRTLPVQSGIRQFALHPSKEFIAINTLNSGTILIDMNGKTLRQINERSGKGQFSRDGQLYALAQNEELVIYAIPDWEVKTRFPVYLAGSGSGLCAFSRDGKLLAFTRSDSQVVVLAMPAAEEFAVLDYPNLGNINALAFDPAAERLFIATQSEDLVHRWNFRDGKQRAEILAGLSPGNSRPDKSTTLSSAPAAVTFWRMMVVILAGVILTVLLAIILYRRHGILLQEYTRTEEALLAQGKELRHMHAELLHSQKMTALGTLAAGIAHDFNNLLQVVRLSNDLIAEAESKREILENVQEIQTAVEQGREVIRSLLGYVRADTGEREYFQPKDIVERLIRLLRRRFFNEVQIELKAAHPLPNAFGSPVRFEQMILNIFINAAEALGATGKLLITIDPCDQPQACKLAAREAFSYIRVAISDNGPGISREHQDRIFEPFFTTKNAGANRGTGLGLTIVYSLAEKEGIGLAVTSAPARGTQFSLYLPVADPSPEPASADKTRSEIPLPATA